VRRLLSPTLVLCAVALASCGGAKAVPVRGSSPNSALPQAVSSLDRLVVRRSDAFPQNHMRFSFPAVVTVHDPTRVQAVARALCGLPVVPEGVLFCPVDLGIVYHLAFLAPHRAFPVVTVAATGCQEVRGLGATRWVARSPGFWQILGRAMGLPRPGYASFRGGGPS
jgi:hypothetical protein